MLTIAPYSGVPPTLAVTRPLIVVGACAAATAGVSPSRTRPSLRVNRTNQRLSAIHFLIQLRFLRAPTAGAAYVLVTPDFGATNQGPQDPCCQMFRAIFLPHDATFSDLGVDRGRLHLPADCPRRRRPDHRVRAGLRQPLATLQRPPLPPPQ